ncbi:hypothetical protein QSV34_11760 [Porticoccus sp. W117]|uniref:hypothetical protein n=1 Tax=Porticoccus sp. W117 TaxID=3054777 RepID=UPI002598BF41|nr:hypothetical protein [Porticoccus sp. W117]MDM3872023.1 hypothetical protein [Porticoccus sp. W117]
MDKKLERSNADKVLRRFAKHIQAFGFVRTKPAYFVREAGPVIEFIHIHKYSFGPCFRMHLCIRVLNEPMDFIALAGPTERELLEDVRFEFGADIAAVESCANVMGDFVFNYAEPWFQKWTDREALLEEDSPLYDDQKMALQLALAGESNCMNVELSKLLLKIA